jgi:predicted RNase H-like HicB family nuclease
MATRLSFTAIYEPVEDGWTQARIVELPAVISAAPTREEAKEALVDALREYLLSLGDGVSGAAMDETAERSRLDLVLDA